MINLVGFGKVTKTEAKALAETSGLHLVKGDVSGDYYLE